MRKRGLGAFQDRNTVSISVEWDIPLWDKARQIAYDRHISLSTLVWEAMREYLDPVPMPVGGRVRDPSEYAGIRNWRVQRMLDIEKPGNNLKLTRAETVHKELQEGLQEMLKNEENEPKDRRQAMVEQLQKEMIERAKKYVKESKKDAKRKPKYKDKEVFEGMLAEGEALLKETKRTKEVK